MKIQDFIFFLVLVLLIWKRDPRLLTVTGLVSLVIAIPLFATWTFFTAERLTWYAAGFFVFSLIFHLWTSKK